MVRLKSLRESVVVDVDDVNVDVESGSVLIQEYLLLAHAVAAGLVVYAAHQSKSSSGPLQRIVYTVESLHQLYARERGSIPSHARWARLQLRHANPTAAFSRRRVDDRVDSASD